MSGLGYLGTIIVGGLAGWVGILLLNRRHSLLFNVLVGVSGSVVGALFARQFDVHVLPGLGSSLAVSALFAALCVAVFGLFRGRGQGW